MEQGVTRRTLMIVRPEPVMFPCEPVVLFDALMQHFPDTDQQVVWADRQLGIISGLLPGRGHWWASPHQFTIYLRLTPKRQTVVTIHLECTRNRLVIADPVLKHVADVASRLSELR